MALPRSVSVLRTVDALGRLPGMFEGIDTRGALRRHYDGHDRVVVLTDEQAHPGAAPGLDEVGSLVTFNVAGYRAAHTVAGPGRVTVAGLSDAGFRLLDLIERAGRADWPF